MTDRKPNTGLFSPTELEALEAWEAPEPPADFAARVLGNEENPAKRRVAHVAVAALILVVVIGFVARSMLSGARGRVDAVKRQSVALAERGIAVVEGGTAIDWSVTPSGDARVSQSSGRAFYRVESGGEFVVKTPTGTIRATGTCFEVEVNTMNTKKTIRTKKTGLVEASIGGVLAAGVVVAVYEGGVEAANTSGTVEARAGEVLTMSPGSKPRLLGEREPRSEVARLSAPHGVERREANDDFTHEDSDLPWEEQVIRLRTVNDRLRSDVAKLTEELKRTTNEEQDDDDSAFYDLDDAQLVELAERCELRWDMPPINNGPPQTLSAETVQKLDLDDEERDATNRAYAEFNDQMLAQYRTLYTEATGDSNVGSLSSGAMVSEINDKSSADEIKRVFQRLSAERAGLQSPPEDVSALSPLEKLYRLMLDAGDDFEIMLGQKIGHDRAEAIRRLGGGFGNQSRTRHGCPTQ